MKLTCEFCNTEFSSRKVLKRHQKCTKYCLKIQNKDLSFSCVYCSSKFTTSTNLKKHGECTEFLQSSIVQLRNEIESKNKVIDMKCQEIEAKTSVLENEISICMDRNALITLEFEKTVALKDNEIETLRASVLRLEDRLQEIASRPTTNVTNNLNLSVFNLTPETAHQMIYDNLTFEYVRNGLEGIANFSHEYLLSSNGTPIYICTDPSRGIFKFINPDTNKTQRDVQATNLISVIGDPVKRRSKEIFNAQDEFTQDFYRNKHVEIQCIDRKARPFWTRIATLLAE